MNLSVEPWVFNRKFMIIKYNNNNSNKNTNANKNNDSMFLRENEKIGLTKLLSVSMLKSKIN